jgi:fucose permease
LTAGLFGPAKISLWAFPMVGFFASVMYSVIFSLALNSLKDNHGAFSGILCSGILGGAIVPLIVGAIGDVLGLKAGMAFIFIPLIYIFSIGFWAKPFINNKTFSLKRMLDK